MTTADPPPPGGQEPAAAPVPGAPPPPPALPDILVLPPDPEAGVTGAPTMNRRRAAVRGALGAVPSPSSYRARLPVMAPAPAADGTADDDDDNNDDDDDAPAPPPLPPLAGPADVLAVHTALHLAGRAAVVRASPAAAGGGWFLVAAPKASSGGPDAAARPAPTGAVPRAAPVAGPGDILDIGEAAWEAAGGSEGAPGARFPPAWEVVAPASTSTPHLTPLALAALASLAPGGIDRPYVVLALVDRDGTVGFSRLYAGIRPPDGAPPRAVGEEEEEGVGGGSEGSEGDGDGGGEPPAAGAAAAAAAADGGRGGRGRGRGGGGGGGGRRGRGGRGGRGRGRGGR